MITVIIRENIRVHSYTMHHNIRAKNKAKTDLTPLDNVKQTIGQTKGMQTLVLHTNLEKGTKVGFSNVESKERKFTHTFKGIYEFQKPNKNIFRNIKRDFLAFRKLKSTNVTIIIKDNGKVFFSENINFCLSDIDKTSLKVNKAIMAIYKINY